MYHPVILHPHNFYPRPPRGGRPVKDLDNDQTAEFLSTPSARRATRWQRVFMWQRSRFLSTPSARRATGGGNAGGVQRGSQFLSTPSARRATCEIRRFSLCHCKISIHALREEGDLLRRYAVQYRRCISIHALREEGDPNVPDVPAVRQRFLSTPSARRATRLTPTIFPNSSWISIHALREEGDIPARCAQPREARFLSTPSARRATRRRAADVRKVGLFLSTPSARRATKHADGSYMYQYISIHALREEGDLSLSTMSRMNHAISIHALREEGDGKCDIAFRASNPFLSTPSARRATISTLYSEWGKLFLSTPSARRATWAALSRLPQPLYFYPRPPRGGRLW